MFSFYCNCCAERMRLILFLQFVKVVITVDVHIIGINVPDKPYSIIAHIEGKPTDQGNAKIDKISRSHLRGKDDIDVENFLFYDTQIKYFPLDFFVVFQAVQSFYILQPSSLMTSFENGHFANAKKMQKIFIANQAFGPMKANVFEGAVRLQKLYLENCLISSVHQKTFQDLKTLTELSMQGNLLQSLPEYVFSILHELETLNLKNNLLTTLPPKLFEHNQKLKKIFLNVNRLLFITAMTLPDDVEIIQLQENLCINEVFHNIVESQKKTGKMCDISLDLPKLFEAYKHQQENAHNCNSKDKDIILEIKDKIKALKENIVQLKSSKENFKDVLEAVENVEVCGVQRNEL